jgi:hypothetical protein
MSVSKSRIPISPELELERVISLGQAEESSGLSCDTIKRRHADKIIHLSPRRRGIKLKHALALSMPAA